MRTTKGIEGLIIETHNWGKSVAFWKGLGFELEFETDHHSGRLRHPAGGLYVFLAERPPKRALEAQPVLRVADAKRFKPPRAGKISRRFTKQHWGVLEMLIRDPDGRRLSVQAPLDETAHGAKGRRMG